MCGKVDRLLMACGNRHDPVVAGHSVLTTHVSSATSDTLIPNTARVIHVFVAREGIQKAGAWPLIWSTGLMSPEAYTLEAGIAGWLANESPAQIRQRAAVAYDRYQHCGVKAAARLLVAGW